MRWWAWRNRHQLASFGSLAAFHGPGRLLHDATTPTW